MKYKMKDVKNEKARYKSSVHTLNWLFLNSSLYTWVVAH